MFQSLVPLVALSALRIIVARGESADTFTVTVFPDDAKGKTGSVAATPLQVTGTPAELDAEFANAVSEFTAAYAGFRSTVAEATAALEQAAAKAKANATPPKHTPPSKGGKAVPSTAATSGEKSAAAKADITPAPASQVSLFGGDDLAGVAPPARSVGAEDGDVPAVIPEAA